MMMMYERYYAIYGIIKNVLIDLVISPKTPIVECTLSLKRDPL